MKKIFITLAVLFISVLRANSTTLPADLVTYLKTQIPNIEVRFDGLITLPDKTTYLPLIPALPQDVEKIQAVYTHPAKYDFKKKPEIIVFNDNYVLLKVIKDKYGVTVSKATDYPITVKTGVLPQDLLVPRGLHIPESLEGILGDLKIPVGDKAGAVASKTESEVVDESSEFLDKKVPITIPKIAALKNKLYFVSNYDSNYLRVINSNDTQPLYSLKLESIPHSVIPSANEKYLLITTNGKTYLSIVDIKREEIARQIDLAVEPSEVIVDKKHDIAYVAAKNEPSLFIIDINTMELKQKIILYGTPINLAISEDGSKLIYQDKGTTRLYAVYTDNNFVTKPLVNISNVSKIVATNNAVYAISRTSNELYVLAYPSREKELIDEVGSPVIISTVFKPDMKLLPMPIENLILAKKNISKKPVDMLFNNNKLYILSAAQNQMNVYDTLTNNIIETVDLPMNGFSKNITRVGNTNYVIISNASEQKYLIFDLNTNSTVQQVPVNTKINNLVILQTPVSESNKQKKESL